MPLHKPDNVHDHILSLFSLQGKVVVVTGGSRGIGLELVRGMAEAGAEVAMIYNTTAEGPERAAEIAKANRVRVEAYKADVTDRDQITLVIQRIAMDFGRIDVVVANAGVCSNVKSLEYTDESWQHINRVNYDGVMWTALAAGPIFKKQGYGNLIVTGSVSSILVNIPQEQAAYNASKAAAVHLGKCLAVEWVDFARVNCVSPGYVGTKMVHGQPKELMKEWLAQVPGRRIADPAELRGVYVFLASDASSYLTGSNIVIDGGYTSV